MDSLFQFFGASVGDESTMLMWCLVAAVTLVAAHVVSTLLQAWRFSRIESKRQELAGLAADFTEGSAIPVTIITGFLGSGKTTLLNSLLQSKKLRICVIENEVGSVSLDHKLLEGATRGFADDVFVLKNGCVCCTASSGGMSSELERVLDLVLEVARAAKLPGERAVEHVVIETSGLADPAPLIELLFSAGVPETSTGDDAAPVSRAFHLQGVVTVVDAKHGLPHLEDAPTGAHDAPTAEAAASASSMAAPVSSWFGSVPSAKEARRQVGFADCVLVNKSDLVSPSHLKRVEEAVRRVNPLCELHRSVRGVPDTDLASAEAPELPTPSQLGLLGPMTDSVSADMAAELRRAASAHASDRSHSHSHGHGGRSETFVDTRPHVHGSASAATLRVPDTVPRPALEAWLGNLVSDGDRWRRLYRVKGIVNVLAGEDGVKQVLLVQGVHAEIHLEEWTEPAGKGFLVLIGVGIEAESEQLQASLTACSQSG
jgi:G3E family GTPase